MLQRPFESRHGSHTIRGTTYVPEDGKRHPAALLLHSFAGNRIESGFLFVQLARALASAGIAAVTFDFRHSGESDGSFDQMLVTGELADSLRLWEWTQGQSFVDRARMGIVGLSLGGLLAACTSARVTGVRALVMLCPTTADNLIANVCRRNNDCPPGLPVYVNALTLHPDFEKDARSLDPMADVVKRPRPTLVVHGSADKVVAPAVGERYAQAMRAAGVPVDAHFIEGADHFYTPPPCRAELLTTVTRWLSVKL